MSIGKNGPIEVLAVNLALVKFHFEVVDIFADKLFSDVRDKFLFLVSELKVVLPKQIPTFLLLTSY